MYEISKATDGKWHCSVRIQDGTERWIRNTKQEAIESVISGARTLNGSYIREDDIRIVEIPPSIPLERKVTEEEFQLLQAIKRGSKKVLEFDHYLLKYRITKEEADMLIDIREGKLKVKFASANQNNNGPINPNIR